MISLCRAAERRCVHEADCDFWRTFHAASVGTERPASFGALIAFDEIRLSPGKGEAPHPAAETEIVSYVFKGALSQDDSTGASRVVHAGEFQRLTTGLGVRHRQMNASLVGWTHVFRITLSPPAGGLDVFCEQRRFAAAERRNALRIVASPDGRKGSLRIHQDALVCSSILDDGHHVVHELKSGRSAWLHIVYGEATFQDLVLTQGDGVGVSSEPSVSLTVMEGAEILLVDVGPAPP